MRTKIFSLFLVLAMFATTGAFSTTEEEIPGASKHKVKLKFAGRVQVKYETDLHKQKNEWGSTGSGFAARRLRVGGKIQVGKIFKGLVQTDLASSSRITYAWGGLKIAGPLWLSLGQKNVGTAREHASSGKLLHGDTNRAVGSIIPTTIFGAQLHGSVMKDKLHFSIFFQNAGTNALSGRDSTTNSWQYYGAGFRFQFDPMGKWKHGKEWFQTKKTKMSFGLAGYWEPKRPTTGTGAYVHNQDAYKNLFAMTFDFGVSVSMLYVQGGVEWAHAGYETSGNDKQHLAPKFGYFVDVAFTTMGGKFVPAIRYQAWNSDFANRSAAGTQRKRSAFHFTANIYPYGMGHRFKLQPELIIELQDKAENAATGVEAPNTYDKDVKFRATATLNF